MVKNIKHDRIKALFGLKISHLPARMCLTAKSGGGVECRRLLHPESISLMAYTYAWKDHHG